MLTLSLLAAWALTPPLAQAAPQPSHPANTTSAAAVNTTTCNGQTYTYRALAGYGLVPGNARDKYGDTLGGLGSSIAIEHGSWTRAPNGTYTGVLWALPDRGWNTNGTLNYTPRVHKLALSLTPAEAGTATAAGAPPSSAPNLQLDYLDTVLFRDPAGEPVTGLDAGASGHASFPGFPDLPVATYTGDGFGGNGTGGRRVSVDSEGLVLGPDGAFWVSDEYGPYVYKFSAAGRMEAAIRPPDAFIPVRNGSESFSADSPPLYDPDRATVPEDPTSGRANNQGFEGLTISPDGTTLSFLVQSALMQEGGASSSTRRHARLVQYDISSSSAPRYAAEYVVPLPLYTNAAGKTRVAAQSELLALGATQFLVLARDSNAGRAAASTASLYRHADVFDISGATDISAAFPADDGVNGSVASAKKGELDDGVVAAEYCAWLDYNVNAQLERFGLHNGGEDDVGLLNEKWESLAVVPVLGEGGEAVGGEWFVFSLSDDDFITQDGYMNFGRFRYADETGANLDNQALVFRVGLPAGAKPYGWA